MMRRAAIVDNVTKYLDDAEQKHRGQDREICALATQTKAKLRLLQTELDGGSQIV